jgi:hypothetical protein
MCSSFIMSELPIHSSQPAKEKEDLLSTYTLESYGYPSLVAYPGARFSPTSNPLTEPGPFPPSLASVEFPSVSPNLGNDLGMEIKSTGNSIAWLSSDIQSDNTPQLHPSSSYLHYNHPHAGGNAYHQPHASEIMTPSAAQGYTDCLEGSAIIFSHQSFSAGNNALDPGSNGTSKSSLDQRPVYVQGFHILPSSVSKTYLSDHNTC